MGEKSNSPISYIILDKDKNRYYNIDMRTPIQILEVDIMVNRFVLNAISYHGKGAIKEIPGLVAAKGFKKAFVASDPDLVKFGVTK